MSPLRNVLFFPILKQSSATRISRIIILVHPRNPSSSPITAKIKSVDGDIKIINNGTITEIINHSISNSLVSLEVSVAYESDIKQVEKVLTKFCERVSKENDDIKEDLTLLGITNLGESGITFKMVGYVTNGKQFEIQRKLNMLVKLELDKHNITIPYPHMVIVNE